VAKSHKPSPTHTVTGHRILSSCYFVQLTHLKTPNLNTHHATQTNNTQPSRYTANHRLSTANPATCIICACVTC